MKWVVAALRHQRTLEQDGLLSDLEVHRCASMFYVYAVQLAELKAARRRTALKPPPGDGPPALAA